MVLVFDSPSPADVLYSVEGLGWLSPSKSPPDSAAGAVNNLGQIIGYSMNDNCNYDAVLWDSAGHSQNLGSLAIGSPSNNMAAGINNLGQVVGSSTVGGTLRAFLWSPGMGMQDLGTIDGLDSAQANGINDSGQIIGTSGNYNIEHPSLFTMLLDAHAFVYTAATGMQDLGTLPALPRARHSASIVRAKSSG